MTFTNYFLRARRCTPVSTALRCGLFTFTCVAATNSYAERLDDTSLYIGLTPGIVEDNTQINPNVMFIFDSSGSMGNPVPTDVPLAPREPGSEETDCRVAPTYDPTCDYGSSNEDYFYMYRLSGANMDFEDVTIHKNQNACQAMVDHFTNSPANPVYSDRVRQWRTNKGNNYNWRNNPRNSDDDSKRILECFNDRGVHGLTGASADRYIDRGNCNSSKNACNAPYQSTAKGEQWNQARIFTFVPANYHDYLLCVSGGECTGGSGGGSGGGGGLTIEEFEGEVDENEVLGFGPFIVAPDTAFIATMYDGTRNADLYVRRDAPPDFYNYSCRGTTSNSFESCSINTGNSNLVYVTALGVHTSDTSTFKLSIMYEEGTGAIPDLANNPVCDCERYSRNHCGFQNSFVNVGNLRRICQDKLSIMQSAASNLVKGLSALNVGLMRFNGERGGYILQHVTDVDGDSETGGSNRDEIIERIDGLDYADWTPLSETLYEAFLYFSGERENYGYVSGVDSKAFVNDSASSGARYQTPITEQCQPNHIVLLTDGEPTRDGGVGSKINGLQGVSCGYEHSSQFRGPDHNCLDDLAGYMATNDLIPSLENSKVATHTIGFSVEQDTFDFLQQTARKGNGLSYSVDSAVSLLNAFQSIILSISAKASTFVAPAVTVNAFNELQHRNEIYYAVFEPSSTTRWPGNVKKYRIDIDGNVLDANDQLAIDLTTGFFTESARSFWSPSVDGADVRAGGFKEQLPFSRTVYVFGDGGINPLTTGNTDAADLQLEGSGGGGGYTNGDQDYADDLVRWALGDDVFSESDTDGNQFVADPLHGRPFVVTYGCRNYQPDGSCLDGDIDDTLFVITNLGFLHAIDAQTGVEEFAVIPEDLLQNLDDYADPDLTVSGKAYGLDGNVTLWVEENLEDSDRDIEPADGDFVRLFAGMRRGGTDFYALDVADRSRPERLWHIRGPDLPNDYEFETVNEMVTLSETADRGFEDMGQSWSAARLAGVNWGCNDNGDNCAELPVLVISGGYDPRHDENSLDDPNDPSLVNEFGNALYIVNAENGDLLWSAGNNNDLRTTHRHDLHLPLTHSIPASPALVDAQGDGLLDIIYIVDIAGGVWRLDINSESRNAADFATGGQIFNLAEGGQFRRFFNRPDVVVNPMRGGATFASIVIGSGLRPDPRNEEQNDRIYVLFNDPIFTPPGDEDEDAQPDYIPVAGSTLYNARAEGAEPADRATNAPFGYFIDLPDDGEKVLQSSVTLNNVAIVTSYLPNGNVDNTVAANCEDVSLGGARAYFLDIFSGQSALSTASLDLKFSGIPVEPTIVFAGHDTGDGSAAGTTPVVCIGTECFGEGDEPSEVLGEVDRAYRRYWRENTLDQ